MTNTDSQVISLKDCSLISQNINLDQKSLTIELSLSMCDFDYGDIYIQFYDDPEEKDEYCAPIIIQFTNTPTVYRTDTFKINPSKLNPDIEDYDPVFSSAYGSELEGIPDVGRTDVLTEKDASNSEYYNDFLSNDRLVTNGLSEDSIKSIKGHPVYSIKYCSFVPAAFSKEFRNRQ